MIFPNICGENYPICVLIVFPKYELIYLKFAVTRANLNQTKSIFSTIDCPSYSFFFLFLDIDSAQLTFFHQSPWISLYLFWEVERLFLVALNNYDFILQYQKIFNIRDMTRSMLKIMYSRQRGFVSNNQLSGIPKNEPACLCKVTQDVVWH